LVRSGRNSALRLFELLRGTDHVLLLYADDAQTLANVADVAAAAREQARGRLRAYAISPPELDHGWLPVPVVNDADGQFREAYGVSDAAAYLVRPDGYVGYRQRPLDKGGVIAALSRVMG
jgi:pentachlorophenol monooxygenase